MTTTMIRKSEIVLMTIVLTVLGTAMHFAHHSAFLSQHFFGYIFPVNESPWEHMKMVFMPQILAALYLCLRTRSISALAGPILAGALAIPLQLALFYIYWPFVGHSILIVDVIAYLVVMIIFIPVGVKLSRNEKVTAAWPYILVLGVAIVAAMAYLTYNPGDNVLFLIEEE